MLWSPPVERVKLDDSAGCGLVFSHFVPKPCGQRPSWTHRHEHTDKGRGWNVTEMLLVPLAVAKPKLILTEVDKNNLIRIHFKSHEVPVFIFRHLNTSANLPLNAA